MTQRRRRESRVIAPPVQPDLLRLVDRAHQEPDLDREQLDIRQVDFDVAGDDESLIEHPVENIDETVRARWIG